MASKARINYWVDVGLVASFILSMITGLIKWPGFSRITGISYTFLPMLEISIIHDWSGLIMVALVLLHIILHFNWMIAMTKGLFKKKRS
jgi:hypothetical protein